MLLRSWAVALIAWQCGTGLLCRYRPSACQLHSPRMMSAASPSPSRFLHQLLIQASDPDSGAVELNRCQCGRDSLRRQHSQGELSDLLTAGSQLQLQVQDNTLTPSLPQLLVQVPVSVRQ